MIDQHLCFDVRAGRPHAVVHRHGLDDGPVAGLRRAGARRDDRAVRRDARLSRARPACGKSASDHRRDASGHRTDRDTRADGARRRAAARARPFARCASSAAPANPGTPSRGSGFSPTSAAVASPIINYSGGTEIGGGIVGCFPTMPLVPNSFHGPVPGMVADVYDADGNPVRGEVGELVVARAVAGDDAVVLGRRSRDRRRRALSGDVLGALPRYVGARRLVRSSSAPTAIDSGTSAAAATTRSTSPASASVRPSSRARSSRIREIKEAAAIAVPDELKGDVVVVLAVAHARADEGDALRARTVRDPRPRRSASRCGRRRSTSSTICRRRATSRSCAASRAAATWASRTSAISPPSKTPPPSPPSTRDASPQAVYLPKKSRIKLPATPPAIPLSIVCAVGCCASLPR